MKIQEVLQEESLLLESGIKIPKGTKSAKILHHDDFDGVISAVAMGLQLKKQGIPADKITTDILHDRDEEYDQEVKLAKRKNQILIVVDFDRFKNRELANKKVDVQTDHHESINPENKNSSSKSVGKTEYGSDVLHISTVKAQGFLNGTDLEIMNGIDSAKFGKEISTNIYLQKELKKNDGVKNKKMRLAIITSSVLGQLVRSSGSVNQGAVKSIINNMIKSPSLLKFYTEVKKHINLQKEQVNLLKAYEGKSNGEIDWEAINNYNEKAPKEMRIGITKAKTIKKSEKTGRKEAASEEELAKRNKENQAYRDLYFDKEGNATLKSKDVGDADLPPWEVKNKFNPLTSMQKNILWRRAEIEAKKKIGDKWDLLSAEEKKSKIVDIWKKSIDELQKNSPGILRKTENISKQIDMMGNRYLAFEDKKIAANIRDFWKFWQMAMRPDYYDKFIQAAKAKNKEFKPEEINLVDLGKKSLQIAKSELFTIEELKKRGFSNPEKVLSVLNKAFDISYARSGGHKSITNIDLKPIFSETFDKYNDAVKKAKELSKGKSGETAEKLKEIEKKLSEKSKQFSNLLRDFKVRTQTLLSQFVQEQINKTKKSLQSTLKESILLNSGIVLRDFNSKN